MDEVIEKLKDVIRLCEKKRISIILVLADSENMRCGAAGDYAALAAAFSTMYDQVDRGVASHSIKLTVDAAIDAMAAHYGPVQGAEIIDKHLNGLIP